MSAFAGNASASASAVRNRDASLAPRRPKAPRALALALIVALAAVVPAAIAAEGHVDVPLSSQNGITGNVQLVALPHGGTMITVVAKGLTPGEKYLSLYYDNTVCEIEK